MKYIDVQTNLQLALRRRKGEAGVNIMKKNPTSDDARSWNLVLSKRKFAALVTMEEQLDIPSKFAVLNIILKLQLADAYLFVLWTWPSY